ncbi:hypothetical protein [Aromatoleum petrolei]|uniref:Uncharacterized protein n=1 Tax=Aromatoleum petrolei TaxID=76116 RepID=A0ABX1MPK2_9RHOO|nr:hypothetical protein [Aromatoleum petrolei]NMF89884.1 hypothetical protein [Aromatoleum petrolei]QTQ34481.1 Uncharacterized protein ToN1_03030 [Aromatoleum petrolei]
MKHFAIVAGLAASLAVAAPAGAHEGHEHAAPAPTASTTSAAPRFEAQTEDLEVVGVLDAGKLTLYVDRRQTNEPVGGAQVEVEGAGVKALAAETSSATYQLPFPMPAAGKHPLTITVQAGDLLDLVAAELQIAAPLESSAGPVPVAKRSPPPWLPWSVGGVVALLGISLVARRRRSRPEHKD